jgi:DNA-binding beta-propeller fold protein YncE
MHGLEYDDSTGTLYGASTGNLLTINKTTGQATVVGPHGQSTTGFLNLGYNTDTNVMYGTHTSTDSFYSVDRATGFATLIGPMNGPTNPHGLAWDSTNDRMFLVDSSTDNLFTIDLTTGATSLIGSTGTGNLLGLVFIPEIPEPSTLALAGIAAGAALLRRRT